MLSPSVVDLLEGVADALASTVVDELPPGPARQQVKAAIAVNRRVARALPTLATILHDDCRDMTAAVPGLVAALTGRTVGDPAPAVRVALEAAAALPPDRPASLDELLAVNRALREAVAQLAEQCGRGDAGAQRQPVEGDLEALLTRMTEREASLRLSPWER